MIRIANWAHKHVVASRLLIAILHVLVFLLAYLLSQLLTQANIQLPVSLLLCLVTTSVVYTVFLGQKKRVCADREQRRSIQKRRFFIVGLACTFLLIGLLQRSTLQSDFEWQVQAAFTTTTKKKMPVYEEYADKKQFFNDVRAYYKSLSKKELLKELKQQGRHLKKVSKGWETAALVFALGILASVALFFVAGLACSLACNGQGALAWLVFIGGTAGIVVLLVVLAKAYRRRKKRQAAEETPNAPVVTDPPVDELKL